MTQVNKRNGDDELSWWVIIGGIFTATLIGVDIWYSSYSLMNGWLKAGVLILHFLFGLTWFGTIVKFNDPKYDKLRRWNLALAVMLILIIGIHHALALEDAQILK